MVKKDGRIIRNVVIFLVCIVLVGIWLFTGPDSDEIENAEGFAAPAEQSPKDEDEADAEAEANKDLKFYVWGDTVNGDEIREYITLSPNEQSFTFTVVTNFEVETAKEIKGYYSIDDSKITLYIDGKEYKGTVQEDRMVLDEKNYVLEDDTYI